MAKRKQRLRRPNNSGGIIYNKDGSVRSCYVNLGTDENGKRKRKYITVHSEEEAEKELSKNLGRLSGLKLDSLNNNFLDTMKEWLLIFKINEVTSRVFENVMRNYNLHIKPYFNNVKTIDVDTPMIKRVLNIVYAKKHSMETYKKVKTIFRQFFDYAVEEKLVQFNPVLAIKPKKKEKEDFLTKQKKDYKALTPERFNVCLSAIAENLFILSLCLTEYYSGLRIGETLALTWKDIDFVNNTLNVDKGVTYKVEFDEDGNTVSRQTIVSDPKSDCSKAILPMTNLLKDALQKWHKIQEEKSEKLKINLVQPNSFIFGNDDGTVRTYYGTRAIYRRHLEKHNLIPSEFHFHTFRYTFGTMLKDNGENIYDIQMLLRHASAKTTEIYLSYDRSKMVKFKSRLDTVFEKAAGENDKE